MKNHNYRYILILFIVGLLIYQKSLNNSFLLGWDDDTYILNNELIKNFSFKSIKKIFSTQVAGNYHPLTVLSNCIEYSVFGSNPKPFHFINIIFHILNSVLLYKLTFKISGKENISIFCALVFLIHPSHSESVLWIAERKDVLFAFFYFISLIFYIDYIKDEKSMKKYFLALLFFIFSCLSKPAAITLPIIIIIIDFYIKGKLNSFINKIPFFILAIIFAIITLYTQKEAGTIKDYSDNFDLWDKIFVVIYSIYFYLVSFILPYKLSAFHSLPLKNIDALLPFHYYISVLLLILVVLLLFRIYKKDRKEFIFGVLFFISTISVTLQIISFGGTFASDRYTYVPYWGLSFLLAIYLDKYLRRNKYAISLVCLWLISLSIITYQRVEKWQNTESLFRDAVSKYPKSYYANYVLASALKKSNKLEESLFYFDKMLVLNPSHDWGYSDRASLKQQMGNLEGAKKDLDIAIKLKPNFKEALYNRGVVNYKLNMKTEACIDFKKSAELGFKVSEKHYLNFCK